MTTKSDPPQEHGIDSIGVAHTLLRIVAQLQKTEYSGDTSTKLRRRDEVRKHPDTADPASETDTSQG